MPRRQKKVCVADDEMSNDVASMPAEAPKPKPKKAVCLKTLEKNLTEALRELEQLRNPPDVEAEYTEKMVFLRNIKEKLDDEFQDFLMRFENIWDPFTLEMQSKMHLISRH